MDDNFRKQMLYEKNRKSIGLAYLLWIVLGAFGVHRFYAGANKSAVAQLILTLTGVGLLVVIPWLLIDLFLIPGLINERNMETIELLNGADEHAHRSAHEPQPVEADLDSRRQAMLDDLRKTGYRKERRETNPLFR